MPRNIEKLSRKIELAPSRINWDSYETSFYKKTEERKHSNNKIFIIIFAVLFLSLLIFLFYSRVMISGRIISLDKTILAQDEPLKGSLELRLREGEFLPRDMIVRASLDNEAKNISLTEFIQQSGTDLHENYGDYFFTKAEISGSGFGYGWRGKKVDHVQVFFELEPEVFAIQENQESRINGSVVYGEEFVYDGTANLVLGSVRTSDKQLGDNAISIKKENEKTIVKTEYFEEIYGFGEDYLTDKENIISLDLSKLNFAPMSPGDHILRTEFVYQDRILISESKKISVILLSEENETLPEMPVAIFKENNMPSVELPQFSIQSVTNTNLMASQYACISGQNNADTGCMPGGKSSNTNPWYVSWGPFTFSDASSRTVRVYHNPWYGDVNLTVYLGTTCGAKTTQIFKKQYTGNMASSCNNTGDINIVSQPTGSYYITAEWGTTSFSTMIYNISFSENDYCGQTISSNFNLTNNLLNCPSNGLNIGANNLIIDCKGYKINGTGIGINAASVTTAGYNVTVRNCTIEGFATSIDAKGANNASGDGFSGGAVTVENSRVLSISSNGGSGKASPVGTGGSGGIITLINSNSTNITSSAGSAFLGGNGGRVNLTNSNASLIIALGASGEGTSLGGIVQVSGSAVNEIDANTVGGYMIPRGVIVINSSNVTYIRTDCTSGDCSAGNVTVVGSFVNRISAFSGYGSSSSAGKGGLVNVTDSVVNLLNNYGNNTYGCGGLCYGKDGGDTYVWNSTVNYINSRGGDASGGRIAGKGGNIVAFNSNITSINVSGGFGNVSSGINGTGGAGGNITLINSNLNLTNVTISLAGGSGAGGAGSSNGTTGTLKLNQTSFLTGYGAIKFSYVQTNKTNFNSIMNISNNSITLYSNTYSDYNKSANLTLNGILGFGNPLILRDGVRCNVTTSPSCYNFTSLSGNVIFNVSSFTNYSIGKGPLCGETINSDINLTGNLTCSGTALTIGNNNIILDCKGYALKGDNSGDGININGFNFTTIKNCNIETFNHGITIGPTIASYSNQVLNSAVKSSLNGGLWIKSGSSNNVVANSTIEDGVSIEYSNNNNITGCNVSGSSGISLMYSDVNIINTIINSTGADFVAWVYPASAVVATNVTFASSKYQTKTSFIPYTSSFAGVLQIDSVDAPNADPSSMRNISNYLDITTLYFYPSLHLNISYSDSNISKINESSLKIYRYSGSWVAVPESGVDTANKIVYATGISSFSQFALLGIIDYPVINFISPTPANNFLTRVNYTTMNVSVSQNVSSCTLKLVQTTFNKTFGGAESEYGYSVQQISDGYVISGQNDSGAMLVKTNSSGDSMWIKNYGFNSYDAGYSVEQTSDSGFIISGATRPGGTGNFYIRLIKTNSSGDMIWNKSFGGTGISLSRTYAHQTSDGGYIVGGEWYTSNKEILIIKTDSSGTQQWSGSFGLGGTTSFGELQQTADEGYIITSQAYNPSSGDYEMWLIKTNSSGSQQWNKTFPRGYSSSGYSVQQTSEGGYIVAGHSLISDNDFYLVKTDSSGNHQWNKTFDKGTGEIAYSVKQTSDKGYILSGGSYNYGSNDAWIVKTDSSGNMMWNKSYGTGSDIQGNSIIQTSDKGYAMGGWTNAYGAGNADIWLLKMNVNGNLAPDSYSMTVSNSDYSTTAYKSFTNFSEGTYDYYANCTNMAGDSNASETRSITYEQISCGTTITANITLTDNILNCLKGLKIGADNLTVDCNGYKINGTGYGNGINATTSTNGYNITIKNCIISNFSVDINAKGADNGRGGIVRIENSNTGTINADGGTNGGSGGNGGNVLTINSNVTTINANGVAADSPGAGGIVEITSNSIINAINVNGFSGSTSSNAGNVTVSDSSATFINAYGGAGGSHGGKGGIVTITSSNVTSINASGGYSSNIGGNGGTASIINSKLNLTNITINIPGGIGGAGNGTAGTLKLNNSELYNPSGIIKFFYVQTNKTNFNSILSISNNLINLNSSIYPSYNVSANLTLYNISFNQIIIRVKENGNNWKTCSDCTILSYAGGNLTFNVSHFSAYAAGENSSLNISDDTDTLTKNIHEIVKFYANFSNSTSPISGANCSIKFNLTGDWEGLANMSYNGLSSLHEYSRTFQYEGNFTFNVLCDGDALGYNIVNMTDNFVIYPAFVEPNLTCSIEESRTCSNGRVAFLRMQNKTGGYVNAHAQVANATSFDGNTLVYNNTLCCGSTYQLVDDRGSPLIKLENYTNSHAESPLYANYPFTVYFGVIDNTPPILDASCTISGGSCPSNYTCLFSMVGIADNLTNTHVGDCSAYDTKVCCVITEDTPPVVALLIPTPDYYSNSSVQQFRCNSTDDKHLANVTLYVFNSTDTVNQTATAITGQSNITEWNVTLPDGIYQWDCLVSDSSNQTMMNLNRTLTVDTVYPTIEYKNPTETSGNTLRRRNILINVSANDTYLTNITIYLYNSTLDLINHTTVTTNFNYVNYTNLGDGIYYFNATAFDLALNSNSTGTRNVTLTSEPLWEHFKNQFTTNFSIASNISAVGNATVGNEFGLINWTGKILSFAYLNLDDNINISQNYIFLNSTALPNLNTSAILTIYNLSFSQAIVRMKEDGSWIRCPDCTILSYTGGNLTFNASHFAAYAAGENSSLNISDDTDTTTKNIHEIVKFYANFSNSTSPISGANCSIKFNLTGDWEGLANMSYNGLSSLHEYSRTFQYSGNFTFNVLCNGYSLGYDIINTTDNFTIYPAFVAPNITCSIEESRTCSSDGVALLRMKNDTGGYENAHVQPLNVSDYDLVEEIYNNTLCCKSNYQIVSSGGTAMASFLKLSNYSNAHAESPLYSNYTYGVYFGVIDSTVPVLDVGCALSSGSCPSNYTCLLSMASSENDNLTNAHAGSCSLYDTKVCCVISHDTPPTVSLVSPDAGAYIDVLSQTFSCNSFDNKALSSVKLYVWNSSNDLIIQQTTSISGTTNQTNWTTSLPYEGAYTWNCRVYDSALQDAWAVNRTFTADITQPTVQFVSPTEISGTTISRVNIIVNATISDATPANITIYIYNSSRSLIYNSTSFSSNNFVSFETTANGLYYFNATAYDLAGHSNSTETRNVTVSTQPIITAVYVNPSVNPVEDNYASVLFYFTAFDYRGAGHLSPSSASASFIKAGETSRSSFCSYVEDIDSNSANYSCSIDMWYWDKAGSWTVNASISDNEGRNAYNNTATFNYNELIAFVMSPDTIYWGTLTRGASNQIPASGNFSVLRNTGNAEIASGNVEVKAADLIGAAVSSYIIKPENFTASPYSGISACSGTALQNNTYINIIGEGLPRGNQSTNNLYYCLVSASSDLIKQSYSTLNPWYVKIVVAFAVISIRRKKKLFKEIERLKTKYHLDSEGITNLLETSEKERLEGLAVPISLFRTGLSPLESIVKYMKENLGLKLSEIAEIINRDERTIWITYRNANIKRKERISIAEKKMISIKIFSNRNLSVLENLAVYLNSEGMKNSEIAKILGRDVRIIYTLQARARKKLQKLSALSEN
jgi:hypothetical protein